MVTALGTLVFIHRRQRLRRHQALRDYYIEQMELSRAHITLALTSQLLTLLHIFLIASAGPSPHCTTQLQTVIQG